MDILNDFETCLDRKSKTPYNVIYDIKKKYKDLFLIEVESLSKDKEGGGKKKIIKANVIVF
jgi:hypothetical protein